MQVLFGFYAESLRTWRHFGDRNSSRKINVLRALRNAASGAVLGLEGGRWMRGCVLQVKGEKLKHIDNNIEYCYNMWKCTDMQIL